MRDTQMRTTVPGENRKLPSIQRQTEDVPGSWQSPGPGGGEASSRETYALHFPEELAADSEITSRPEADQGLQEDEKGELKFIWQSC